jgi:dTDP-4-amino-4,6-dideoxygalactose transaminase
MTSGEGGMVATNDPGVAAKLRMLRSHGEESRYSSSVLGFNYRLTEMGAAIALAQLSRLASFNEKRAANARYLSENLRGVIVPPAAWDGSSAWHLYTIRVREDRDALARRLGERGIQTGVYYPTPVPDQPLYRELGFEGEGWPNARRISREVLSLPVHPALTRADLETIVEAVNEWAAEQGGAR